MFISLRRFFDNGHRPLHQGDSGWTLTTGTDYSGYPISRMLTENTRDPWLAWGQAPSHTWIQAASLTAPLVPYTLSGISLLGLNRYIGDLYFAQGVTSNTYRVRAHWKPLSDRIRPGIASISLTNLTGSASDISDPLHPPVIPPDGYVSTRLEVVNPAVNTQAIVTFDDHTSAEVDLSSTASQRFYVYVADSASASAWPTITVTLRRNGADVGVIAANSAEKTAEGYIIEYLVTAGSLPAFSGAFGLKIAGTSTGSSAPEIICVSWVAELETTGGSALTFDSGDVLIEGPTVRTAFTDGIIVGSNPSGQNYVHVEFSRLGRVSFIVPSPGDPLPVYEVDEVRSGLTVGRLVLAEWLELTPSSSDGRDFWNVRPVHGSDRARKRGGGLRTRRGAHVYKEAETRGVFLLEDEAMDSLLHAFYDVVGPNVPVLVMPHEDRPQDDLWAVIERWDLKSAGVAAGTGGTGRRYDLDASFMEYTAKIAGR